MDSLGVTYVHYIHALETIRFPRSCSEKQDLSVEVLKIAQTYLIRLRECDKQ